MSTAIGVVSLALFVICLVVNFLVDNKDAKRHLEVCCALFLIAAAICFR